MPLLLLDLPLHDLFPAVEDGRIAVRLRSEVLGVPRLHTRPYCLSERAVLAEMGVGLRRNEAKEASGVMLPSSNRQHVSREQLPVKCEPGEKLTLGLRACIPYFLRIEMRVATQELDVVSGASAVRSIRGQSPRDGVWLLRHKLKCMHKVPYLQVL
jgi:hypothetical protein